MGNLYREHMTHQLKFSKSQTNKRFDIIYSLNYQCIVIDIVGYFGVAYRWLLRCLFLLHKN